MRIYIDLPRTRVKSTRANRHRLGAYMYYLPLQIDFKSRDHAAEKLESNSEKSGSE